MELQVALDRLALDDAVRMARQVSEYADWIEVGTSLIKEYGMQSVRALRAALPDARILADIKTNDNARYEFELCFAAGGDAATVMGTAPDATVDLAAEVARDRGKTVFIDLLATPPERQRALLRIRDAIFGIHVSKDVQEIGEEVGSIADHLPEWAGAYRIAVAGGIGLADIAPLAMRVPAATVIVGSAITGAADPVAAARAFRAAMAPRHAETSQGR